MELFVLLSMLLLLWLCRCFLWSCLWNISRDYSVYLSALSVMTVGYGDRPFNTLLGYLLASVWLLVSTLSVARAFCYLVEARIHKRQCTIAKWVLRRDITPADLFAANINNSNDFIKYVYVHLWFYLFVLIFLASIHHVNSFLLIGTQCLITVLWIYDYCLLTCNFGN